MGKASCLYDVTSLFTSVPIKPALDIIWQRLANDQDLQRRTSMTIQHIITLLDFCLNSTSFMFQGKYYQQMEGAAMGSPLSPIIANIFMEHFEQQPWLQLHTPQVCGKDMWMIPLSSWKQNTKKSFSTT